MVEIQVQQSAAATADADLARIRAGATPAGDAQPYRVVGDEDSDDDPDE